MGKLKSLEIVFERNKSVFFPGDEVNGKCVLELRGGEFKLNHIKMTMRGVAKVHWTESRSTGNRLGAHTEHYYAEVEYFLMKQLLHRSIDIQENGEFVLEDGVHEFPFSFQLPSGGISTSFEGKYGSVRYWITAEIEKPWSFNNKTKKAFTVIKTIDINRREYLAPVANSAEKSLCCWCCKSGPISLYARTDRKGYCPGESIAITASFENDSNRTIIPQATFSQTQTFVAGGKIRCRKTKFTAITGLGIQPGKRSNWDSQLLKIPAVSPSIINCCLIKVDYNLRISLLITGGYNVYVDLPIVIGTVPLRRRPPRYTSNSLTENHSFSQVPLYRSTTLIPDELENNESTDTEVNPIQKSKMSYLLLTIAPPSYAECISGAVDIRDEDDGDIMGDTSFTPMYTYVNEYEYQPPPDYSEIDPCPSFSAQS